MATVHKNIANMSRSEYQRFCAWLRDCADSSIGELIKESLQVQQEAFDSFYSDVYAW